MTYEQTLDYLYSCLPMYQRVGNIAFKKDLSNTIALLEGMGNPHLAFKSIHIAGTNGKGSSAHALSSVLQEAGYTTGLYTSPHLKSFTERIRINGVEIPQEEVIAFVAEHKDMIEKVQPSFFEMTVAMAFWHFAKSKIAVAVIETGLGGRLDSTNVITPELSLITNISFDHMAMLGNTLPEIAAEKAGIIKPKVPVVISQKQEETWEVFANVAERQNAPLVFADASIQIIDESLDENGYKVFDCKSSNSGESSTYATDLIGPYQRHNIPGILSAVQILQGNGWHIAEDDVRRGLKAIKANTGLKGRWQILNKNPLTICDTSHNEAGLKQVVEYLNLQKYRQLWLILGFTNDKDLPKLLRIFPADAKFLFCQADIPRAMKAEEIKVVADALVLDSEVVHDVNEAIAACSNLAAEDDIIFIGGSSFVVAEIDVLD